MRLGFLFINLKYRKHKVKYMIFGRKKVKKPPDLEWSQSPLIQTPTPSIGVVIGTYGAPAYVALQLEARKKFYPELPCLIHDDSSLDREELKGLCKSAEVDFATTSERHGWSLGDMAAIVAGLDWGRSRKIDIIVKLSRRFLICNDWHLDLQKLAYRTQYATYGNACGYHNLPFRPECMGMHVETWHNSGAVEEMRVYVKRGQRVEQMIERWYQARALRIHQAHAPAILKRREYLFPRDARWGGYAIWDMLGLSRRADVPGVLWHEVHSAEDYFALAQSWGIVQYSLVDFQMPDINEAVREEAAVMGRRNPDFERKTASR